MKLKTAEDLDAIDAMYSDPIPLFFQSGYLTIKDFDPEFLCYRLDFPNKEVEQGFARFMAVYFLAVKNGELESGKLKVKVKVKTHSGSSSRWG